jgi:hypothetical protein
MNKDIERLIWNHYTEGLHEDDKQFLYYLVKDGMGGRTAEEISEAWQVELHTIQDTIERLDGLGALTVMEPFKTILFDANSFSQMDFSWLERQGARLQ